MQIKPLKRCGVLANHILSHPESLILSLRFHLRPFPHLKPCVSERVWTGFADLSERHLDSAVPATHGVC